MPSPTSRAVGVPAIRPGVGWNDTAGRPINAHGGGMLSHEGAYYWYGSVRAMDAPGTQMDGGISLYSSRDLYDWDFKGIVLPVFNGSSSTGNGLDLERPKVVRCTGTGKFVMWVRGTGYGNTPQLLAVATADAPTGPFVFEGNASNPFHTVNPGNPHLPVGYQYADATLFQDPVSGDTFVYWRTRVNQARTGFRAMRLAHDCLSVVPASDTQLFTTPDREAPAVFTHAGTYYLWTSGTRGWEPADPYLYYADKPLGDFAASSNPGHGWHSYTKNPPKDGTAGDGAAGDGAAGNGGIWEVRDGYLPMGNVWGNSSKVNTTLARAMRVCGGAATCRGFCFESYERRPAAGQSLLVAFKTAVHFVPENPAAGIQPAPIPQPGQPGNTRPTQPGAKAFDSQSTYILPNPAYTPGSSLAQFVYMADRWNYSAAFGVSKATYVWLPLFVDEHNRSRVAVTWHDNWRLDNATSPFKRRPKIAADATAIGETP